MIYNRYNNHRLEESPARGPGKQKTFEQIPIRREVNRTRRPAINCSKHERNPASVNEVMTLDECFRRNPGLKPDKYCYLVPGKRPTSKSGSTTTKSVGLRPRLTRTVKLITLINENFLSTPFLFWDDSVKYHLTPLTLIEPTFHICQRQGFSVLWKGLGSTLLVRGMTLGIEDIVCKVTNWPKEINRHSKKRQIFQHILLKSISFAAITPFYAASLVETVQSEVASEATGF